MFKNAHDALQDFSTRIRSTLKYGEPPSAAQYAGVALIVAVAILAAGTLVVGPHSGADAGVSLGYGQSMGEELPQLRFYVDKPASVGDLIIFDAGDRYIAHEAIERTEDGLLTAASNGVTVDQGYLGHGAPPATNENIAGVVVASISVVYPLAALLIGFGLVFSPKLKGLPRSPSPQLKALSVTVLVVLSTTGAGLAAPGADPGAPNPSMQDSPESLESLNAIATSGFNYSAEWSNAYSDSTVLTTTPQATYTIGEETVRRLNNSDGSVDWSASIHRPYEREIEHVPGTNQVFVASGGSGATTVQAFNISTGAEEFNRSYSFNSYSLAADDETGKYYLADGDGSRILGYDNSGNQLFAKSISGTSAEEVSYHQGQDIVVGFSGETTVKTFTADGTVVDSKTFSSLSATQYSTDEYGSKIVTIANDADEYWKFDPSDISGTFTNKSAPDADQLAANKPSGSIFVGRGDGNVTQYDGDFTFQKNQTVNSNGAAFRWLDDTTIDGTVHLASAFTNDNVEFGTTQLESSSTGNSVSGVVKTQTGDACANCTVVVTGVNYDNIVNDTGQTLEDRANELLEQARNPKPPSWTPDRQLVDGGLLDKASSEYPAVYPVGAGGEQAFLDTPQLGEPSLQVPANQKVLLTAWDPNSNTRLQDGWDSDMPGTSADTPIVVEQLGPDGSVVQEQTVRLSSTYDPTVGSEHAYGTVELSAGFYRISVKNSDLSYTIVAGQPDAIAAEITDELEDKAGSLTDRAKDIRQKYNDNKFTRTTTTTTENGSFSVDVGSSVKTVSVTAYKVPRGMDAQNATRADIRAWYEEMLFSESQDGLTVDYQNLDKDRLNLSSDVNTSQPIPSFYLPERPTRVDVPANDTVVRVYETTTPEFANVTKNQNRSKYLEELLEERLQRIDELFSQLNASREEYKALFEEYTDLVNENQEFRQRVLELLEERSGNTTYNVSDPSTQELKDRIWALETALSELQSTIESESETEVGDETITSRATFQEELSEENVAVLVKYSNGTTETVPDQYVTIDQSPAASLGVGSTTVSVEELPLGSASSAEIIYQVVSDDGVGRESDVVRNPTVPGKPPAVPGVRLSTMSPEPGERVSVELKPAPDSSYTNLTAFSARYVSNGTAVANAERTGQRSGAVTPNCACKIQVRATYEDSDGQEYQRTFVLQAAQQGNDQPASIRAQSGPTGVWALVSDGVESGDVEKKAGELVFTAQIAENADVPSTVHAYVAELDGNPNQQLTVNVVRGSDQEAVKANSEVIIHTRSLADDAQVYRGEGATVLSPFAGTPITDGSSAGTLTEKQSKTIIRTYAESGDVTVTINNDPSVVDKGLWLLATSVPDVNVENPLSAVVPAPGAAFLVVVPLLPLGVFVRRRE